VEEILGTAHADSAPSFLLFIFKSTSIGYPQARGIVLVIPLRKQAPLWMFFKILEQNLYFGGKIVNMVKNGK
jgi:hypothetical protein